MIKIHVFHTGSVVVDRGIPYKEKNPLAPLGVFRGKDKKVELPVSAYLIEHPRGLVVFDTGWSSRYVSEAPHRFFGLLNSISKPVIRGGQAVDERLAAMELKPSDIDWLVFSHMDFDHTSGLEHLKEAKHICASQEEIADAKRYFLRYVKQDWNGVSIEPFSFERSGIGPVGRSFDLFGDGSVVFVNTPGHTHGHVSALLRNGDRCAVLAGDAFYTQTNLERHILPGFTVDKALAEKSLEYMIALSKNKYCVALLANHDPAVKEQIIEL